MTERAIHALLVEMLRSGVVDAEILNRASAELEAKGEFEAALDLEAMLIEARSEPAADYVKRTRRPNLRVVPDGGKS